MKTAKPKRPNAINIMNMASWWTASHGDTKGGTFNLELYLDYLRIRNEQYGQIR